MTYEMDVAGLKRELPICKVTDDLHIGAFVMFGDVELTVHCASELLKRAPEYDYLIAPLGGVFAIYELLPSFIVACIFIVVVSLCTAAPEKEIQDEFDSVMA